MRNIILFQFIILMGIAGAATPIQSQNISEIKMNNGVPSLYINGIHTPPFAYMSYLPETKYYQAIAATGTHLYCFPAYLGDRGINAASGIGLFRTPIWLDENKFDFSSIEKDFEKLVNADTLAKVIIRIYLDPPLWWEKKNPKHACFTQDGKTFRQCFASDKWRAETGQTLKTCINWLKKSPYAKHLVGIHVAAGSTEEWFYHAPQRNDLNPIRTEKFRKWLIDKYKNETALKSAWKNDKASFDSATLAETTHSPIRAWLSPSKEQKRMDTYQFHSEILVGNIAYFCKIVKECSQRQWLTGAFYGYHNTITDPRFGHGALSKLLQCNDIDYISSPNKYHRVIGEDWPPMVAVQSVLKHGKLWLAENDTRTCLTTPLKERAPHIPPQGQYEGGVWTGPEEMTTSVSFLWKNAGRMLAYGYGGWWFDMWGGWYNDPQLLNVIQSTKEYFSSYRQMDKNILLPQVCVVVDEQLCFMDASYGELTERIISNSYPLARTGVPFDHYLRTDLSTLPFDQYKVIWLMGILELSTEELALVKQLRNKGITVLWTDGIGTHCYCKEAKSYVKEAITFTDSQLRAIFREAGAHVYSDSGDVFYLGHNWMCIHSSFGGKKVISFPFDVQIIDPSTQKELHPSTNSIQFPMEAKSTIILRINPTSKTSTSSIKK